MVARRAEAGGGAHAVAGGGRTAARAGACAGLLIAFLLAACGGGTGVVEPPATPAVPEDGALTVRAFEWGFQPEAIALRLGEPVRVVLKNEGGTLHNWKVEEFAADDVDAQSTGPLSGSAGQLFVGAEAGRRGTLTFTPQESGAFTFYCTIRDHRQLGMEGTLTVG